MHWFPRKVFYVFCTKFKMDLSLDSEWTLFWIKLNHAPNLECIMNRIPSTSCTRVNTAPNTESFLIIILSESCEWILHRILSEPHSRFWGNQVLVSDWISLRIPSECWVDPSKYPEWTLLQFQVDPAPFYEWIVYHMLSECCT